MGAIFYIWDCDRGEHKTPILLHVLRGIEGDLVGSSKGDAFVDFVCPQCGYGRRRLVDELRQVELESPPANAVLFPQDLFHESLKCDRERCAAHARVHTPAETSTPGNKPKKPVAEWAGMTGITCSLGHPIKVPVQPWPSELARMKRMEEDRKQ